VASLAKVLVLVGVGVALAKSERERRVATRARLARGASLASGEPRAAGLRRVILGQLDRAIELLEDQRASADEQAVHELRKIIKRVRAIVRLLREELGAKRFAREDAALRDCGRRVAGARDAEVMVGTLEALCKREPKLAKSRMRGGRGGVEGLRAQLVAERDAVGGVREEAVRGAVAADLRAIRTRVAAWELHEHAKDPTGLLAPGIERVYGEGRRRMRRARRSDGDLEAMHAWRKRVKALRYAAETVDRRGKSRETKSGRRLHRTARRADRLGELLGEEHDLALLERVVRGRKKLFVDERKQRKRLLRAIARRRRRLRKRALREGERLYERKPKAFVRGVRKAL
jgi:CHAD domain-containing protein